MNRPRTSCWHCLVEQSPGTLSWLDRYVLATMLARFEHLPRAEFPADDRAYEEMKRFFRQLQAQLIDDCINGTDDLSAP